MAGKVHEMMFTLAAKQQASFGTVFSGAKQEFHSLYNEAAALTQQQNDISAFTKMQSAVESTQNSLARYREKLQNVRDALETMKSTGEGTTQETLRLQQQEAELSFKVNETTRKLTEQEAQLGTMGSKLEEAGIDTNNLAEAQDRIQTELDETKGKMDEIDSNGDFMDSAASSLEAFGSVAAAVGAGKIFQTIVDGMKACTDAAADFEFGMSAVSAIANSSTDEMDALSQRALEIGATTMYTATEAADALSYMALAGWSSAEMLEGVDGVITLAAAAGEDLASVSDIVTDALTAFGLSASDSAGFVDVLASAAAKSNTTVNMLGEAFKYAAPVAGALGYSIEDVAVAMGLMANNGIKGSQAGTTLRNVFNALTGDISLSSDAFGDIVISAVNADGTMMSLSDTIQMLRGYFDQMSESEKVQNAQALAGTRAYAGLLAILNTTEDDFNSLTDAIENSTGAAQRMADVRMDNVTGQLTLLQSAFNGLEISIGSNFTPILSDLYAAGTDVLNWMTDVADEHPALVTGISATALAFGGLTAAILAFNSAKKLASKIGLAELLPAAGTLATLGAVAAALGLIVAGVASGAEAYNEMYEASMSLTAAGREQEAEIADLTAQYDALIAAGEDNSAESQILLAKIESLTAEFESGKQSVQEYVDELNGMSSVTITSWDDYHATVDDIDAQSESTVNLISRLQELSSQAEITAGDEAEMAAIIDILNGRYEGLGLTLDNITGKNPISLSSIAATAEAAAAQERYNLAFEQYGQAALQADTLAANQVSALEELTAAENELASVKQRQKNEWDTGFDSLGTAAEVEAAEKKVAELREAYDLATQAVEENTAGMEENLAIIGEYTESADDAVSAVDEIRLEMQALEEAYADVYNAAWESFQGQFGLFEEAPQIVATSTTDLISALSSQTEYFEAYAENLTTIKERIDALNAQGYDTSSLEAYISAANDGSVDAANAFAAIASASDDTLLELNSNYAAKQAAEADAAAATAEMETNFSSEMASMEAEIQAMESTADATLTQLASDFDKSAEAGAAGNLMMSTYNSTLAGWSGTLYSTGRNLTQSFVNGMNSVSIPSVPSLAGYAKGTENAPPGWAWVGEGGPELMRFKGGEQVLNHEQSVSLMNQMEESAAYAETAERLRKYEDTQNPIEVDYDTRGSYTEVTIAPVISISGVGTRADMEEISDELIELITDMVMDTMQEAGVNAQRGKYR